MTTGSRRSKHLAGKAHATACHGCPHVRILYIHTLRSIPLSIHGNVYLFFEALVLIRWGRGCTKIRGNRSWSPSAPFFFSSPRFISSLTLSLSPFLPPPPPLLLLLFLLFFFPLFNVSHSSPSFFTDARVYQLAASYRVLSGL